MNHQSIKMDRNTFLGLMAILLWSSTVALARRISEQLGPLTAGASVFLTAGILLTVYSSWKNRSLNQWQAIPRKFLFLCGALFVIYMSALFLALGFALNRNQTLEIALLNYLWPSLTLLFSLFIVGNKADLGLIPGTLLALLGIFLVMTHGNSVSWSSFSTHWATNPLAYGLGVLAAITWGLYSNLSRYWGGFNGGGAMQAFTLAAGIAFWLLRLFRPEAGSWTFRVGVEVAVLALATALAYEFWDRAMRKGNMVLVVACSYLTPFFSTIASCLYLRVMPGRNLWLGCFLIIAGSFLSWRSVRSAEGSVPRKVN